MADTVWGFVERRTPIRRQDPATWPERQPSNLSFRSLKRRPVFRPLVDNERLRSALDDILGPGGWAPPKRQATILLSFPTPGPWTMPDAWHMDCGFEVPTWPVPMVRMFSFFGPVAPAGGGTLLLEGGHHLVERYMKTIPVPTGGNMRTWGRFLRQHPWLDALRRGGTADESRRDMLGVGVEVDGVEIRAVELTGEPGDLVLAHLHVFHSAAPNVSDRPRQMLSASVLPARAPA